MKYEVWSPRYHQVFATLEEASRHIPPVGPAVILYGSRRVMDYRDGQAVMGYVYE